MLKNILKKTTRFFQRVTMSDYERYLSEATDVADLERRIKYGNRPEKYNQILYPYGRWG